MAVEERGARKGIYVLGIVILFLVVFFVSSANATDQVYGPYLYPAYNGSTEGYIMMWDNDGGSAQDDYLRAALSTPRDSYAIGKTVAVYIRTDGYFSQDCGWWYTQEGETINYLNLIYPNKTQVFSLTGLQTGEGGVYDNRTFFKVATSQPMGTYKIQSQVTGAGGSVIGEDYAFAVYFDVGGELNLSVESYTPEVNITSPADDANITVDIYQPNGEHFDDTVDGSDGSVTIHAGIILPNESYWERSNTTTTGYATIRFPVTEVGRYFVVLSANGTVGDAHVTGRTECNVVGLGEWPTAASLYGGLAGRAALMILLSIGISYPVIRSRRGGA